MKPGCVALYISLLSILFVPPGCCFKPGGEDCPPEPDVYEPITYEQPGAPQEALPQLRAPVAPADEQNPNELAVNEQPATTDDFQYGKVTYLPVEGGFWGIVTNTGKKYDPINLPQEFRKEGLQVKFRAEELKDRVSFHMWGTLVRILEISRQ